MSEKQEPAPAAPAETVGRIVHVERSTRSLWPEELAGKPLLALLMKADEQQAAPSNMKGFNGLRQQPANFKAMGRLLLHNPYHSACINAKTSSTVGLGLKDDSVPEVLDELTNSDFTAELTATADDFFCTGNGYLEVVREDIGPDSKITGIHFLPSAYTFIIDEGDGNWHYEVIGMETSATNLKLPRFGDSRRFAEKYGREMLPKNTISEVIHFKRPTALNRWYGLPNWMSTVTSIELMQALDQREFDFFINRGVPEFMLFILGAKAGDDQWKALEDAMKAHVGLANSHKSLAMNLPEPEAKVQLEKLDLEGTDQGSRFATITDSLSLKIVSGHQVPPLLAGIQIAGKLAANNELPNAIRTFQILTIAPAQEIFENRLETTLGNPKVNGRLFGARKKKMEFRQITDELDLLAMQALGGAKTPGAAVAKDAGAPAAAGGAAKLPAAGAGGDSGSAGAAGGE